MSTRVHPELHRDIARFGGDDITKCMNCGNCTAVCSLAGDGAVFPRKTIRYMQLGLKDKLLASPEPWLCYYCGECSDTCPRDANPAETMMAMRRWLTAEYDHSGRGRRLYTSEKAVVTTILKAAFIPLALLLALHAVTGFQRIVTDRVELNTFAPVMWVWAVVLLHFAFLGYHLMMNALHMIQHIMKPEDPEAKVPWAAYLLELKSLAIHFITQKRWRECGEEHDGQWLTHLLLVSGYVIMLVLVVGMLGWFQTDNIYPVYHPQRWLGYYATLVLIYASAAMLIGRFRKRTQVHRFSRPTDWLFPSFILVGAITGILVHAFRYAGWPWPTYGMYLIHVMAMVAMLDSEVGIGKWAHMIYRPLAIYLMNVKKRTQNQAVPEAGALPTN